MGDAERTACWLPVMVAILVMMPGCTSFTASSPAIITVLGSRCGSCVARKACPRPPALSRGRRCVLKACEKEPVEIRHPRTGAPSLFVVPAGYSGPGQAPHGSHELLVKTDESWGDGFHPTTGLVLEFLSEYVDHSQEQLVLDYGTGSAVLGMAALKLGARSVVGIDIDDEALDEVTSAHAMSNVSRRADLENTTAISNVCVGYDSCSYVLQAALNMDANKIPEERMRLFHTREVIQDLDGIVLRDEPGMGALTFDLVTTRRLDRHCPIDNVCQRSLFGHLHSPSTRVVS